MQYERTFTIHAPLIKVWQALTNSVIIEQWAAGAARMDQHEESEFSLYEGKIHGINTRVVPQKLLQQHWRGPTPTEQMYDVTFTFDTVDDTTTAVHVAHMVALEDIPNLGAIWEGYYFEPIKQLLEKQTPEQIKLKFTRKENVIGNVWSFFFEPSQPLTWTGGQYIRVELMHDDPDSEGTSRWFTIASAPYEGFVQIATRLSTSTFKQALNALPVGGELVLLEKPAGDFVWEDSDLPHVFVSGGIGITAFHSILKQRIHDKLPLNVIMIYGNRDATSVPFKEVLDEWAANDPSFVVHYVTDMPLITDSLLGPAPKLMQSLVYISGPEAMVDSLGDQLLARGLPKSQLKLDGLANYTERNY